MREFYYAREHVLEALNFVADTLSSAISRRCAVFLLLRDLSFVLLLARSFQHEELALKRYVELDERLNNDPRLAALHQQD
jgi:hypothetical protein